MCSMPLGNEITLVPCVTEPTGEMTAAVPQSPHSANSESSANATGRSYTFMPRMCSAM